MTAAPDLFDPASAADHLAEGIRTAITGLGRRGAVVAVSGGVDSGVVAGLCVRALGPKRVMLLRLPERQLSEGSSDLGLELATKLGAPSEEASISPALDGLGYRDLEREAIREVFPDYADDWKHKIVRSPPTGSMIVFSLTVEKPEGTQQTERIPSGAYRKLLAATNMKQRTRKLIEYTWADRLHYAVAGTPNLVEYDQGFFVKGGDGLADLKPIAGLYKSQVFALARFLDLPAGIAGRAPTTETFSLTQSQEEFYYGFPHDQMDVLLWGEQNGIADDVVAEQLGLDEQAVEAGYWEIARRREATEYLHAPAVVIDAQDVRA
ncbi:MAG: NAD synthetase [uncultured Solirubrobacteraceae bacterium]|uniref:NH(3)-dependent NAD(+) synthetase n=1 Tax=uncultured Solirubrobacteraceae bacterium TaxID=1162706 RepID=A0A6J4SJC4_9ACTN|nr:MAG: NAD synthetase [uncultured Solirubrobacteraceae bacterium]